jgi:hypothetical protein
VNVLQTAVRTTYAAKTGKMASFFNLFPARRKNKGELRKEMPFFSGTGAFFQMRKKAIPFDWFVAPGMRLNTQSASDLRRVALRALYGTLRRKTLTNADGIQLLWLPTFEESSMIANLARRSLPLDNSGSKPIYLGRTSGGLRTKYASDQVTQCSDLSRFTPAP